MKRENINLIILLIIIIIPLIMLFSATREMRQVLSSGTNDMWEEIKNADDENEKAGALLLLPLVGVGTLATAALVLVSGIVILVTFTSAIIVILARAIIKNKKNKVGYRILMTLVFIPYTILAFMLFSSGMAHASISSCLYGAIGLIGIIYVGYNTYTSKMFIEEEPVPEAEEVKEPEVLEEDNNK